VALSREDLILKLVMELVDEEEVGGSDEWMKEQMGIREGER
jgi:hypothetical protein